MSKPTPGTYYIINRRNSPYGERLAITFNGSGAVLTAKPLTNADSQKWRIVDFADGVNQYFIPYSDQSLQAALGTGVIIVLPAGDYVFFARVVEKGLSIQSGNGSAQSWGIGGTNDNLQVTFMNSLGYESYFWVLQAV